MKRQLSIAIVAATLLNVLFFLVIGWAWYHSEHRAANKPASTVQPALATQLVSAKGQPIDGASANAPLNALLANTFQHKVILKKQFQAPGGLDGLVLALKNSPTETFIAYFDPDKKLLYLGQVINAKGVNTTMKATQTYIADPAKPKILAAFAKVPAVVTGAKPAKHTITILIDPNSPYFKTLYQNFLLDTVQEGLQIRWVLVNYLKPMGPNLAGWVLSAADPAQRLAAVATAPAGHFTTLKVPALKQGVVDQLRKHWDIMQAYHLVPGPVTLFQTKNHAYVIKGLVGPESFDQLLPELQ